MLRGIHYTSELAAPVHYKGIDLETELRCDLFVEGVMCVELKAVDTVLPIHEAQLLTYMKLLNAPKGILLNFNVTNLYADGQRTFVSELFRMLEE